MSVEQEPYRSDIRYVIKVKVYQGLSPTQVCYLSGKQETTAQ